MPANSLSSIIHMPCNFSAADLSFMSAIVMESEYHACPIFLNKVLLPIPCSPHKTKMVSNFIPGLKIRATAATNVLREIART